MQYTNPFIKRIEKYTVENYQSEFFYGIRRIINPLMQLVIRAGTSSEIILEEYPELEKDSPYIFCSTHGYCEEINGLLSTIDRNVYTLIGTTDQMEHNPKMYMNWATGLIYVNREDKVSRESAIPKMEEVINHGTSILLFPEGRLNNTENQLCQKLFYSPYYLAKSTGAQIVPISAFQDYESKKIFISASEPISIDRLERNEAMLQVRDALATLQYNQFEKHAKHISRASLGDDPRLDYMKERRDEYFKLRWTEDVFDEELTGFIDKIPSLREVLAPLENAEITAGNCHIIRDKYRYSELSYDEEKYDFTRFMHKQWKTLTDMKRK